MSFQAMAWAYTQPVPDAECKLLLLALANYAGHDNACWPSITRLSKECLLTERTIKVRLHLLRERNLITVTHRKKENGDSDTNIYQLTMPISGEYPGELSTLQNLGGGVRGTPPWGTPDTTPGVRGTPKPINIEPINEPKKPPIVPQGGRDWFSNEVPAKPTAATREWKPDPIQRRLNALFKRRDSTIWSPKELKAFKELGVIDEEDLRLIEEYYQANIPAEKDYRRRDMVTLLNNFNGELDRARQRDNHQPESMLDKELRWMVRQSEELLNRPLPT